ncbi:thymidine kinase [bacterium TMED181]|nr:thymidine kinase [Planctomycetota bacterium]OUW46296.1 MAG: thymidine kinase [bacterium TMED181]
MAKLYFRHGTVGSAKTLNLLAVAHNYERQGKKVVVIKPGFDNRYGETEVTSRAGLTREAHLVISADDRIEVADFEGVHCVLVDEVQFFQPEHIDQLRDVANQKRVPVICYGLRSDFRTRLFPGSRRLLELADSIEEVKTTCHQCNSKAIFNLKSIGGVAHLDGPSQQVAGDETFQPVCSVHYSEQLSISSYEELREEDRELA